MYDSSTTLTFIIVAFCFAIVIIMKRNTIEPAFKRYLAIAAIVMVALAFALIVYSFLTLS